MSRELHQRLADLKFSLNEMMNLLQHEQDESENDHIAWDTEREEDELDDEPEIIDNSDSIGRYERAIGFLDQALKELDND